MSLSASDTFFGLWFDCLKIADYAGAIVGLSELSATSAPSVADVLKAVSKRLEEKIADLDQTNKEYQKVNETVSTIFI